MTQDIHDRIEGKYAGVRDAITGVAEGYHTGVFISGEGGLGKSFTVLNHLNQIAKDRYTLHNSRLSPFGLYQAMFDDPAKIHLIEDAETLFTDNSKGAIGVLRSALWSQAHQRFPPREITWKSFATKKENLPERFTFTGGLVIVSNLDLGTASADIRAIQTRVTCLKLSFTKEEVNALIHKIAAEGYHFGEDVPPLPPADCRTVADFVSQMIDKYHRPPDLRMVIHGFRDYLQWQAGLAEQHWTQLIEARFAQAPSVTNPKLKRLEEIALAKKIYLDSTFHSIHDKVAEFRAKTGKGQDAFYRNVKKSH